MLSSPQKAQDSIERAALEPLQLRRYHRRPLNSYSDKMPRSKRNRPGEFSCPFFLPIQCYLNPRNRENKSPLLETHAVTLSKTKKKGREHKEVIVKSIRQALEDYCSAYAFTFENMRNQKLKELREQLQPNSRFKLYFFILCLLCGILVAQYNVLADFFLDRTKSCKFLWAARQRMRLSLPFTSFPRYGTILSSCQKVFSINSGRFQQFLRGDSGLFCTNLPKEEVERYFFGA